MSVTKNDNFGHSSDFYIDCSDDENYGMVKIDGKWMPAAQEIANLYDTIDKNGCLPLEWQCPGRRSPTPVDENENENEDVSFDSPNEEDDFSDKEIDKSDFEFQEEMSHLKLRASTDTRPKGSAKKKTTSLNAILSNMARHRKLDQLDMARTKPRYK